MATIGVVGPSRRAERILYGGMATLVVIVVFVGFGPTYYLRATFKPAVPLTRVLHFHGLVFSGWVVLFVAQAALVAARRVDLHRRLGILAAAWAALMVPVGVAAALQTAARASGAEAIEARRFLAVAFSDLVVFAALVAAGMATRRDPQTHKRLMLLATISLLPPAVARWPMPSGFPPGGLRDIFLLADLALLPVVAFDWRTGGRVHRATLWGGLFILVSLPLRLALGQTDAWVRFAGWMVSLIR